MTPIPPIGEEGIPSWFERLCWRVQIVGWGIATLLMRRRYRRRREPVRAELERRTEPLVARAWGDNRARQYLAFRVGVAIAEGCDWPNGYLIPADSLQTLVRASSIFRAHGAAALAFGDSIGRRIREKEWDKLEPLSVGELVDRLLPEFELACGACGYSLVGNPTSRCPECGEKTYFDDVTDIDQQT